jgi:hypothetical protein
MTIKRILCAQRRRRMPARFSWIDQRFVFDGHLQRCDANAAALYLLLITVADVDGLSYWGDARVSRLLHLAPGLLARSRAELIGAGLIAYERPLYQVLALDTPSSSPTSMSPSASPSASAPALPPERQELLQRLAQLGTQLKAPR